MPPVNSSERGKAFGEASQFNGPSRIELKNEPVPCILHDVNHLVPPRFKPLPRESLRFSTVPRISIMGSKPMLTRRAIGRGQGQGASRSSPTRWIGCENKPYLTLLHRVA